ncbi:MAG TPA: hypothetical protein P5279_05170 [Anaerohalosphaeraceae bacterium]|jgi:hypothetical protein|nr:hypothetical protein [Anaerohalosphaeraceae bacterium]HRT49861.1 hypothetical protein [Anaerohalosphaeraceae bacterium]HRT86753.1 hypothetical protein [Anaerohalosphaeraceae bacterium]
MKGLIFFVSLVILWAGCFVGAAVVTFPVPELEGLVGGYESAEVVTVNLGVAFTEIHSVRIACWGSISPGLGCGDGVERPVFPYYQIPGLIEFVVERPAGGSNITTVGPYDGGFMVEQAFEGGDWDVLLDGQVELKCYLTTNLVVPGGLTLVRPTGQIYEATLIVEGEIDGGMLLADEVGQAYLMAGSMHVITWSDPRGAGDCSGSYHLDYSVDGGESWIAITEMPVTGACSYEWLVPEVDSDACRIRVSDASSPWVGDTTDELFVIYQCQMPWGDFDGSCYIDFSDFAIFAVGWGEGAFGLDILVWVADWWLACGNPFDPMCVYGVE